MPKPQSKKRALESSGDDSSDSGPEDRNVKKPATSSSKAASKSSSASAEEENSWQFEKNRFIKIREFKGKVYVDIREFYLDGSGELKPGKKGISMPVNQWNKLKEIIPEVDAALKKF